MLSTYDKWSGMYPLSCYVRTAKCHLEAEDVASSSNVILMRLGTSCIFVSGSLSAHIVFVSMNQQNHWKQYYVICQTLILLFTPDSNDNEHPQQKEA